MKTPHIVALVVIVACMGVTLFAFSNAVAQHVTVTQAMAKPGETVQVPGEIVKDSVTYDKARGALRFDIVAIDPATRKVDASQRMTVVYAQPKPENFNEAKQVEAIGQYKGGIFEAQNLLIKCPSKYNDKPGAKVADK